MNIALDYDGTYSEDPAFWDSFIVHCIQHGHDVRIVTIRDDRHDRTAPLLALEERVPVIFTRGVAKSFWCLHHADFTPDIWIDDSPRSILENSTATPEWLKGWRAERGEPAV